MKTKEEEFDVKVPSIDGTTVVETIRVMIPLRWDEELKDWILTPEAHNIIEDTKARHMGLLLPVQFKELRERYGYTQVEMGELFQAGEKSWTRWESGKHRPSRSINLLIRALYEREVSINYLLKCAGKNQRNDETTCVPMISWRSTKVANWDMYAETLKRSLNTKRRSKNAAKSTFSKVFLKHISGGSCLKSGSITAMGSSSSKSKRKPQKRFDHNSVTLA